MADEKYTFEQARIRLEEIAAEVRKKDTSLEKSLDLLEEGVRLANICTELVDHPDVGASVPVAGIEDAVESSQGTRPTDDDDAPEPGTDDDAAPAGDDNSSAGEDNAESDAADIEFDPDGFEDIEEPALAASEEDAQD